MRRYTFFWLGLIRATINADAKTCRRYLETVLQPSVIQFNYTAEGDECLREYGEISTNITKDDCPLGNDYWLDEKEDNTTVCMRYRRYNETSVHVTINAIAITLRVFAALLRSVHNTAVGVQ